MTKREYIIGGGALLLLIAVVIIITSIFGGSKRPNNAAYKQQANLIDKALDLLAREQTQNAKLHDEAIADKNEAKATADSLLNVVINNLPKYQNLNKRYENIPTNIKHIANDDDAIKRAFAEY